MTDKGCARLCKGAEDTERYHLQNQRSTGGCNDLCAQAVDSALNNNIRQAENCEVVGAKVDMGKPVFRATEIPMNCDHYIFVDQAIVLNDNHDDVTKEKVFYNGTAISMGNPHFVTFVDDVDSLKLEELGPQFEHHKLFPEGVNTEFVQVLDKNTVKFRVWERGSGETWACGTGASAVAVACIMLNKAGKQGEPLNVHCKGGLLKVTHELNDHVTLEGNAVAVFDGVIDIPESVINE